MIEIKTDIRLNSYFTLKEFCQYEKGKYIIDPDTNFYIFINDIYKFRKWYNRPININSGYRTKQYNYHVHGSINSSHLKALAIDFQLSSEYYKLDKEQRQIYLDNVKEKWTEITNSSGYKAQVNYYDTYLHIGYSLTNKNNYIDKRKLFK